MTRVNFFDIWEPLYQMRVQAAPKDERDFWDAIFREAAHREAMGILCADEGQNPCF